MMPLFTLALALAITGLTTSAPPIPVALAPISEEALHECKAADLEKALRGALGRAKRLRLVPESEEAAIRMEILECIQSEQHKQKFTSKSGPVKEPVGRGVGGGDSEALKSLQHAIDNALTERGQWLLASPP